MKQNTKRWIISTLVSFFTGFFFVIYVEIDNITIDTFQNGAWVGILISAIRLGLKGTLELLFNK